MDTSAEQQQREKDFRSADVATRRTAVRDSIRTKLTQLPKVDHNGHPIETEDDAG